MSVDTTIATITTPGFLDLGLPENIVQAVEKLGYTSPTPIQAAAIPILLTGRDIVGQAQTGTGKTAAFALPALSKIRVEHKYPQVLVLAPTRELAIQVATAFSEYAAAIPHLRVLPIYGGQAYGKQLDALKQGVHVIIGTPGRVMDHIDRKTLNLSKVHTLVLDEADEMLKMGFIDDVETIIKQTPNQRQVALFSATMPAAIRSIAEKYLKNPEKVAIASKPQDAKTIKQCYWEVRGLNKVDALSRLLEVEPINAMLVFVQTKKATEELAEQLSQRGFSVVALNGDVAQQQRERIIKLLNGNKVNIVVATDVAARGLDIDRISHVVNYEIPGNVETYVHRIGRTGRAGRLGIAISFISPREKFFLRNLERLNRSELEHLEIPSIQAVNAKRIEGFKQRITDTIATADLSFFTQLITEYQAEHQVELTTIAASLAKLLHTEKSFLLDPAKFKANGNEISKDSYSKNMGANLETYRIEVGKEDGLTVPELLSGIQAITGIEGKYVGNIALKSDFSLIDLPDGMTKDTFSLLKKAEICGKKLKISKLAGSSSRENKPRYRSRDDSEKRSYSRSNDGDRRSSYSKPQDGEKRSYSRSAEGEKRSFSRAADGEKRSYSKPQEGAKRSYAKAEDGEKRSYSARSADGEKRSSTRSSDGERRSYSKAADGEKRGYAGKSSAGEKRGYAAGKAAAGEKRSHSKVKTVVFKKKKNSDRD